MCKATIIRRSARSLACHSARSNLASAERANGFAIVCRAQGNFCRSPTVLNIETKDRTMTSGIPPTEQDFELLSAYLDGELALTARAELESRLAADLALRTAVEGLQGTVALLKAAPRVAPPRNFTLDPAKYRRVAPWWARYRAIQFVGALGTLASIIVIAVGLLSFNVATSSLKNSAAPASAAQGAIVAALATATQNPNTLDKAQSAPLVPTLINATTTPAATSTSAQAADEAALANDSASGIASTSVPTSFQSARAAAPDQQSAGGGAAAQSPGNSLQSGASAKTISTATQTLTATDTMTPTATNTPTSSPTPLPSATNTSVPATFAAAGQKDQSTPIPSPLPLFLLAAGIGLLVLSVMLIGVGWMRSRLE